MTVHMFRVCVSENGLTTSELETAVKAWVDEHSKWEGGITEFSVRLSTGIMDEDTTVYYRGDFRFYQTDTKDNILQKLEDKVVNKVEWYRVGYHACTHDETDPSPCSWDSTVEWTAKDVSIPEYVPDMS